MKIQTSILALFLTAFLAFALWLSSPYMASAAVWITPSGAVVNDAGQLLSVPVQQKLQPIQIGTTTVGWPVYRGTGIYTIDPTTGCSLTGLAKKWLGQYVQSSFRMEIDCPKK